MHTKLPPAHRYRPRRPVMAYPIAVVLLLSFIAKGLAHGLEVHDVGAMCPNHCNAELAWGICHPHKQQARHMFAAASAIRTRFRKTQPNASCKCKPGHGGKDCSFQMSTIYFSEDVYSELELQPLDLQGWGSGLPATVALYKRLCEEVQPNLIIEVGVWKGQSASHFAGWLKEQDRGLLLAVDTWLGAPEFWMEDWKGQERDLRFRNGYPQIYFNFLSNMVHLGLESFVLPFPSPSRMAAGVLKHQRVEADLIHIDAAHEYADVLEDMNTWWGVLAPGGVMLGDDYTGAWPGVVQAVKEFATKQGLQFAVEDPKWIIHKPLDISGDTQP